MRVFKKRFFSLVFSLCFMSCVLIGCGYTTRAFVDPHIKTIYIQPFINKIDITDELSEDREYKTYFPLLEVKITKAIVDRFIFDGNLRIGKPETADVILKGELIDYRKDPLRYQDTDNATVTEYRLTLVVNISLVNRKEDTLIWEETNFSGGTTYFTSGPSAKSEEAALSDAVIDLARRIVERTIEEW
jgi:hypothetical protein